MTNWPRPVYVAIRFIILESSKKTFPVDLFSVTKPSARDVKNDRSPSQIATLLLYKVKPAKAHILRWASSAE
jgi:hypothetical protein